MAGAEEDNKKQRLDEELAKGLSIEVVEMCILRCLPIKCLLQLKCVSPSWNNFISDKLHGYRLLRDTYGLFFRSSISISGSASNKKLYYLDTRNQREFGYVIDPTLSSRLPPHKCLGILDCCNGLLLCRYFTADKLDMVLCVCNPLTGRSAIIPNLPNCSLFLYFNPHISSHYKVIALFKGNIFSSETGNWDTDWELHERLHLNNFCDASDSRTLLNGRLYMASDKSPSLEVINHNMELIRTVQLPHLAFHSGSHLGHSGGQVHYAVKMEGEINVWVLEDELAGQWILKHTVSVVDVLPARVRKGKMSADSDYYPQIMRFHPNLDVIFVRVEDKILSYDLLRAELSEVCTLDTMLGQAVFAYSPFYSENVNL